MDVESGVVDSVLSSRRLNVLIGGSLYQDVPSPPWYAAQRGDNIALIRLNSTELLVWGCTDDVDRLFRPPLPALPHISQISLVATPPGAGWVQTSGIYQQVGVQNPDLLAMPVTYTPPPAPPAAPTVHTYMAAGSGTYDSYGGGSWRGDPMVRQGIAPDGVAYFSATGCWFYGSPFGDLGGLTVTSARIRVTRIAGVNGADAAVPLHLFLHTYASQPGGAPSVYGGEFIGPAIGKGQTLDVDLPVAFGQALQSGAAAGICIYAPDGSDYMTVYGAGGGDGSGLLTITTS
jgi:hypothetical protein